MKNFLYIALVIWFTASCSTIKKTQKSVSLPADTTIVGDPTVEPLSMSAVLSKLNRISYSTFSAKAEVDFTDGAGKKNNFDVKVNMFRDSLIWMSLTGPLSIEGARAIITRDSVKIINKLNREYLPRSIAYLQEKSGLPLDLATLQDLLIGNPIFIDKENSSYTKEGNAILISSQTRIFKNLLTALLPDYLPSQINLEDVDASRNRSAALQYGEYKFNDNIYFSTLRNIHVNYKTTLEVQLNYKSYSFNGAISTPFSVPKGYAVK